MSEDPDFKYIIRIANSDVSGEQRLGYALTSIRGIGSRISNAIIQKLKLDSEKLAGELSDKKTNIFSGAAADPSCKNERIKKICYELSGKCKKDIGKALVLMTHC